MERNQDNDVNYEPYMFSAEEGRSRIGRKSPSLKSVRIGQERWLPC